jgi:hypothetical protein
MLDVAFLFWESIHKKTLKIPKGKSESVKRRKKQTTQWAKEKDKQRSTKHTHKTEDRETRTQL